MKEINEYILYEIERDDRPEPVVTVLADLNYDYIYDSPALEPNREVIIRDFSRHLAGAGGYVSCGLARLGAEVYLLTELGDDDEGTQLYHEIDHFGVHNEGIRLVQNRRSPFTLIFTGAGEQTPRQVATYPGTSLDLSIDSLEYENHVSRSNLVYSCNYFILRKLREEIKYVFRYARERGVLTAYDANAGDGWSDPGLLQTLVRRIYPVTDVVFLNESEAAHLVAPADSVSSIQHIAPDATTVVIKLGARGAVARHRSRVYRCSSFPIGGQVRDTVGAGDSFQAAFLYFYLKKYPIELCMVLGAANAASTVMYTGGTGGQRTVKELAGFMKQYRVMDGGEGLLAVEQRRGSCR
jgi:sugar/nucleoside kinase (ribokinase family)